VRKSHARIAFALSAVFLVLALFVLDGAASGVASPAATFVFVLACMLAVRGRETDAGARAQERGGWGGF
jgi:hypothetical protein